MIISLITNSTFGIQLIKEMECMSNFKIAFFTKVEYKDNFRNKKSKQYMKSALLLGRKNTKQKKNKNAHDEQNDFI